MIKKIILVLILNVLAISSYAGGYQFQKLEEMIFEAEYICEGKVENVFPNGKYKYEISVLNEIFGKIPDRTGNIKLFYDLPPMEDEQGTRYHFILPGSGKESNLKKDESFVFLLKNSNGIFDLLRIEPLENKEKVLLLKNESLVIDSHEKAIQIAKQYLIKKSVDISNHDISLLPKITRGAPNNSQVWRLWWPYTGNGKGGALIVIIYRNGKIEHRYDD
jgi:hypothetical protein